MLYLFVHRKKNYQLLICRVGKNLPVLELINHSIKSSTVAYKQNLVYKASGIIVKEEIKYHMSPWRLSHLYEFSMYRWGHDEWFWH